MKTSKLLSLTILLLCCLLPAQAQVDTTMNYSDFLNDCRNFTRNPQDEVWVVSFWASYNKESLYLIPSIIESSRRYRNKPVRFIMLSTDTRRQSWEGVLNRYNPPGEHILISDQDDYDFLKLAFQHNRLPALFVVEQTGQIRRVKIGDLNALVDALTEELPNVPYYQDDNIAADGGRDNGEEFLPGDDSDWITHTVRRGETLYRIYKKYDVPVKEIKDLNNLRSDRINVGQVLKIKRR